MAGYRRFVAYVYEYRKGKKNGNCGFIRVEVRDQRCRMEVHLRCPGLTPLAECRIYGFVRNKGLMDACLLGVCRTREGTAEHTIETDALNMGGFGIPLGKMGGMILRTENGAFFGTEWDDQTIRPENFREISGKEKEEAKEEGASAKTGEGILEEEQEGKHKKETEEKAEEQESAAEETEEKAAETERTEGKPEDTEKAEEKTEEEQEEDHQKETEEKAEEQESTAEEAEEKPAETEPDEDPEKPEDDGENMREKEALQPSAEEAELKASEYSAEQTETFPAQGPEESFSLDTTVKLPPASESQPENGAEQADRSDTAPENEDTDAVSFAAAFRPPFVAAWEPFSDGFITDCRKLRLQDLRRLDRRDRALCGNRFLQHGYYSFGHLLLGRTASGQYILGVPGGYGQQERFMASMFGFPYFRESPQVPVAQGRGGYWYRSVNAPDFY